MDTIVCDWIEEMVYGKPYGNLSTQSSLYDYDKSGSVSGLWAMSEAAITDIVFLSPFRLQVVMNCITSTGASIVDERSTLAPKISCYSNKYSYAIGFRSIFYTSETEENRNIVLDVTLTDRPDYLIIEADVKCTANTFTYESRVNSTTRIDLTYITKQNVICNTGNAVPGGKRIAHICLPASPEKGQLHRIKSGTNIWTFIHPLGIPIDNGSSNPLLYYMRNVSDLYRVNPSELPPIPPVWDTRTIPVGGHGFILAPLHACTLVYDGAKWLIQEYYDGAFVADQYEWAPNMSGSMPINLIEEPLVICSCTASNKFVRLPPASGSLRYIRVTAYATGTGNSNYVYVHRSDLDTLETNNNISLYVRPITRGRNACIAFISDGVSKWWVTNVYKGDNVLYQNIALNQYIPRATLPVCIVNSSLGTVLPTIKPSENAKDIFIKATRDIFGGGVFAQTPENSYIVSNGLNFIQFTNPSILHYTQQLPSLQRHLHLSQKILIIRDILCILLLVISSVTKQSAHHM